MNLSELKEEGGIVPAELVAQEVEWTNSKGKSFKFSIFIKRLSFGTIEQLFTATDERSRSAQYIAATVLLGDGGKESLSYDNAFQLDPSLAAVFIAAVNKVNATAGEAKN